MYDPSDYDHRPNLLAWWLIKHDMKPLSELGNHTDISFYDQTESQISFSDACDARNKVHKSRVYSNFCIFATIFFTFAFFLLPKLLDSTPGPFLALDILLFISSILLYIALRSNHNLHLRAGYVESALTSIEPLSINHYIYLQNSVDIIAHYKQILNTSLSCDIQCNHGSVYDCICGEYKNLPFSVGNLKFDDNNGRSSSTSFHGQIYILKLLVNLDYSITISPKTLFQSKSQTIDILERYGITDKDNVSDIASQFHIEINNQHKDNSILPIHEFINENFITMLQTLCEANILIENNYLVLALNTQADYFKDCDTSQPDKKIIEDIQEEFAKMMQPVDKLIEHLSIFKQSTDNNAPIDQSDNQIPEIPQLTDNNAPIDLSDNLMPEIPQYGDYDTITNESARNNSSTSA